MTTATRTGFVLVAAVAAGSPAPRRRRSARGADATQPGRGRHPRPRWLPITALLLRRLAEARRRRSSTPAPRGCPASAPPLRPSGPGGARRRGRRPARRARGCARSGARRRRCSGSRRDELEHLGATRARPSAAVGSSRITSRCGERDRAQHRDRLPLAARHHARPPARGSTRSTASRSSCSRPVALHRALVAGAPRRPEPARPPQLAADAEVRDRATGCRTAPRSWCSVSMPGAARGSAGEPKRDRPPVERGSRPRRARARRRSP